jgi:hypothetical protein
MMEHTKEPWSVSVEIFDNEGQPETAIQALNCAATVAVALDFGRNNPGMREANARRIVVCVNALANVSTEWLEENKLIVVLGAPIAERFREAEEEIARLTKQRDELVDKNLAWLNGWNDQQNQITRLTKQRDELAAALEHIGEYWNGCNNETAMHDALTHIDDVVREALAAVKEKK